MLFEGVDRKSTSETLAPVGDFIYWDSPSSVKIYGIEYQKDFTGEEYNDIRKDKDGKEIGFYLPYDHVGIVIEVLDDGRVKYVNSSVNKNRSTGKKMASINSPNTPTETDGTIWKNNGTNEQHFACWCRLIKN